MLHLKASAGGLLEPSLETKCTWILPSNSHPALEINGLSGHVRDM